MRFCLYDNNIIVFYPWFGFLEFGKHMTCRVCPFSHSVRHSNTAVVSWIYYTVLFNLFLILIITMYLRSDIGMYHIHLSFSCVKTYFNFIIISYIINYSPRRLDIYVISVRFLSSTQSDRKMHPTALYRLTVFV